MAARQSLLRQIILHEERLVELSLPVNVTYMLAEAAHLSISGKLGFQVSGRAKKVADKP